MSQANRDSVRISGAHKYYNKGRQNELHVLNDIDLTLPQSGMVAIFGQSGCGKTTLLNAVGGLDRIQSGQISLFGQDLETDTDTLRNRYTGFIFQNYNLNVSETVLENVADALRLCGMTDPDELKSRALTALRCVDMDKYRDRTPDTLSGGQQQRVAIARAIVKSPAVILADEPTGNLDENNTVMVMDILKEISRTRLVLLVTHEANLVDHYCDKVIEMSDGRIIGIRENDNADGYVKRNKNDIWLGELAKREETVPGLTVTCYGDIPAEKPIRVRLISEGGRLYLRCDTPGVRLLDDSSEITLREGVFEDEARRVVGKTGHTATHVDMSALTPFEGEHYGRLFRFKGAFGLAWRENYSKKKKKGNKFFRVCLFALAFVMVIMTSVMAVDIRSYTDALAAHDPNIFYVPLDVTEQGVAAFDYNALLADAMGTHGMDGIQLSISDDGRSGSMTMLTFDTAQFVTAAAPQLAGKAIVMPASQMGDVTPVSGTADCTAGGMVITTAVADELLRSSTVSYINTYGDLVGLVKGKNRFQTTVLDDAPSDAPGGKFHIAGIIPSEERLMYIHDLDHARCVLDYSGLGLLVAPLSAQSVWSGTLKPGEIVVDPDAYMDMNAKVGQTVYICGRPFTVKNTITTAKGMSGYADFYLAQTGEKLPTLTDYLQKHEVGDGEAERLYAFAEWFFGVWYAQVPAYVKTIRTSEMTDSQYAAGYKGDMAAYAYMALEDYEFGLTENGLDGRYDFDNYSLDTYLTRAYWAWTLHEQDGAWPSLEAVNKMAADPNNDFVYLYKMNMDQYWDELYRLWDKADMKPEANCIVSDDDFILLARSAGRIDLIAGPSWAFEKFDYGFDFEAEDRYRTYMMVHASDPAAAEQYLTEQFGDIVKTPDGILKEAVSEMSASVVKALISVTVVLAFMCLSVFFIMRSSFMSRVKEVGILRAIGVTRKNMVFRFFVETVMLTLMTVGLGYALAWLLVSYMQGGVLLSAMMFFPVWIALPELIIILAVCLVFGLLPALTLLRRTPSEILAKYDI